MFYELLFRSKVLAHVPSPIISYEDTPSSFCQEATEQVCALEPIVDSQGNYEVRRLSFGQWLRTKRIRSLFSDSKSIRLDGEARLSLWAKLRLWILGRNTSIGGPRFPHILSVEQTKTEKVYRAIPPVRIHEKTLSGVHRSVEMARYQTQYLTVVSVKNIDWPTSELSNGEKTKPRHNRGFA